MSIQGLALRSKLFFSRDFGQHHKFPFLDVEGVLKDSALRECEEATQPSPQGTRIQWWNDETVQLHWTIFLLSYYLAILLLWGRSSKWWQLKRAPWLTIDTRQGWFVFGGVRVQRKICPALRWPACRGPMWWPESAGGPIKPPLSQDQLRPHTTSTKTYVPSTHWKNMQTIKRPFLELIFSEKKHDSVLLPTTSRAGSNKSFREKCIEKK